MDRNGQVYFDENVGQEDGERFLEELKRERENLKGKSLIDLERVLREQAGYSDETKDVL